MLRIVWHSARLRWLLLRQKPREILLLLLLLPASVVVAQYLLPSDVATEGIPVAIVDHDESLYSQLIVERISQEPLVQVQVMDEERANRLVKQGKIEVAFIIRQGFMEQLVRDKRQQVIQLLYSPTSLARGVLREMVASEVLRLSSNVQAANYVRQQYLHKKLTSTEESAQLWQEAWEHSDSYWEPEPLMTINYREFPLLLQKSEQTEAPAVPSVHHMEESLITYAERENFLLLLGWLASLLMLLMIFLQQGLIEQKESGLLQRIQGFTAQPISYILGYSLPAFCLVLVSLALSLFFLNLNHMLISLLSLLTLYSLFCCALAFFLTALLSKRAQLQGVGLTIVLVTGIFGGILLPLAEWSSAVQILSQFSPQAWLIQGVRVSLTSAQAAGTDSGATQIWLAKVVLGSGTILLFSLGVWRWQNQSFQLSK